MEKKSQAQPPGQRVLSLSEQRFLVPAAKEYLLRYPSIVCLQPSEHPAQALYLTLRHGAVTVARAMELDAVHSAVVAGKSAPLLSARPAIAASEEWERRDLACSDDHGCSTILW